MWFFVFYSTYTWGGAWIFFGGDIEFRIFLGTQKWGIIYVLSYLFNWSNNSGAIDTKMDGPVLEEE